MKLIPRSAIRGQRKELIPWEPDPPVEGLAGHNEGESVVRGVVVGLSAGTPARRLVTRMLRFPLNFASGVADEDVVIGSA